MIITNKKVEIEDTMQHRAGKKFAGSHTTIIDESAELIDYAEKLSIVDKIVLGPIKNIKNLKTSVKFIEIGAGWKIVICGKSSRQEIFFYTQAKTEVKNDLFKKFPELNVEITKK